MNDKKSDQSEDQISALGANLKNIINSKCEKEKSISSFCQAPRSVPNKSPSAICLIYALLEESDLVQIFSSYFSLRRESLSALFTQYKFNFDNQSEEKGVSLEQIGLQVCSFIIFDSEVFEHFYENDDKLFALFSTVYFPTLTEFFTEYCSRLEEANRISGSLKPNDGGRELILETWRKRGMKYHADYTKIVEAIFYVFNQSLEDLDPETGPELATSPTTRSGQLVTWRTRSFQLVNLKPLEDAIQNSLQKWIVSQDEQILQEMKKDLKVQIQNSLLSRLTFAIKELSALYMVEYQPGGLLFKQTIISSSKQIFWFIKDACQACGSSFPTVRLLGIHRSVKIFVEMISCEIFYLEKCPLLKTIESDANQTLLTLEEVYQTNVTNDLQTFLSCQESRNFSFPKKPIEPSLPSPMMRAVFVKLAVLRNRHSAWPRRVHFKIYLKIFIQFFKYIIDILRNTAASPNRSTMLRKDIQLSILIGKRHINYFTQIHDLKNDQKLASQIRLLEKKLIIQFAPLGNLQTLAKSLARVDFVVEKSNFIRQNSVGATCHFNDYQLRDLTRQNAAKLRKIIKTDFYQNCNILDLISPKLYGSLCLEFIKEFSLSEFLEICRTGSWDLYKSKHHILAKGFYELDQTLILALFNTVSVKTVTKTKVLAVLNHLEDELDCLSTYSRSLIFQCSGFFGAPCSEIILERLFFYLKNSTSSSFREVQRSISLLQTQSCSAPNDIISAYLTLVDTCAEVCADYEFEAISKNEKMFEIIEEKENIETKFLASAIKCSEIGEPKWETLIKSTQIDKKDFQSFFKLRNDKGSKEFNQIVQTLKISDLE